MGREIRKVPGMVVDLEKALARLRLVAGHSKFDIRLPDRCPVRGCGAWVPTGPHDREGASYLCDGKAAHLLTLAMSKTGPVLVRESSRGR